MNTAIIIMGIVILIPAVYFIHINIKRHPTPGKDFKRLKITRERIELSKQRIIELQDSKNSYDGGLWYDVELTLKGRTNKRLLENGEEPI